MKQTSKILFFFFSGAAILEIALLVAVNPVAAHLGAQAKKQPTVDWQKLLTDLRADFARSTLPTLQQTRIDRAFFSLNEDDPDQPPFLNFTGVALRTVHDDVSQMKKILLQELSKITLPNSKFVVKVDEIAFHESPIYALQAAASERRKTDSALNVFFERADYSAEGVLQLHVLFLEDAPAAKLAKLYEEDARIAPELLKAPSSKAKAPSVIRRDFDWPAALKELRKRFADDAELFLQRTRLDAGHLAYSADHKIVQFHIDGVCVHPPGLIAPAERTARWKKALSALIPKTTYEPIVANITMIDNPSIAWQNNAAAQEAHDGVFFKLARFDPAGNLSVDLLLPHETQRAAALKLIEQTPVPGKLRPIDAKNVKAQIWDWQTVLPKAQARLAAGGFLQHRTRADRLYLKYDEPVNGGPFLHVEGVCLHPTEVEAAAKLQLDLEPSFTDLLPIAFEHKVNAAGIRFLNSPIYALQTEAVERSLDGLLFADGGYDEMGRLHLGIVTGASPQRDVAKKMVAATPMQIGVLRVKDQPILDFTEIRWADTLHQMQGWLSRHRESLFRKTRLDRGFFSYPKDKVGPDLNVALVGIYPNKASLTARLRKQFATYVQLALADQLRAGPVAVTPMVENIDNPALVVQKKVFESLPLDGVRLDDASFDKDGKLILHGIWVAKSQQTPLDKLVHAVLTAEAPALKRGINWNAFQAFDAPALLVRMRTWVSGQEDIDEVWLERFYFDAAGKTRVSGFSTRSQDKEKAVNQLPKFLPIFENQSLPPLEPMEFGPPKKAEKAVVSVAFRQEPVDGGPIVLEPLPNIAEHLRVNIPKIVKCDGLRIDRCYYDPSGVFRIEGLADHANHTVDLKPFLEVEPAPFDRKRQLGKGWAEGRQIVIPLRPMMVTLAENLPALPEFDGLTLTRAYHDPKNRLTLTGHAVGAPDAKELAKTLKRLLETHPRWRLRTTFGVVIDITDRRPADVELANKLMVRALHLLQVNIGEASVEPIVPATAGWRNHAWPFDPNLKRVLPTDDDYEAAIRHLDAALLHHPKSALAWYLRGYLLQTRNRPDLSRRDFRRLAALESDDPEMRRERLLALELVQGSLRQSAYRLEQEAMIEVADEWTLRVLREAK